MKTKLLLRTILLFLAITANAQITITPNSDIQEIVPDQFYFSFKGVVLYDSRGVFPSFVDAEGTGKLNSNEGTSWIAGPGILDEGYNYYTKEGLKYPKGQYWLNDNNTPNNSYDDYLDRYVRIPLEGANVYIDSLMVVDQNGYPVVTNSEGMFNINVPIGKHYIEIKKDGHALAYNGRFPAAGTTEFFKDSKEAVVFIDTTKVTVVGKVVGGSVEAAKKIGFGENGLFAKKITNNEGNSSVVEVSAKNNIGVADITLGYKPVGFFITPYTKATFSTNSTSGEYRVNLLPLPYKLKTKNITIPSNEGLSILPTYTKETLDFTEITTPITPRDTITGDVGGNIFLVGTPYHYEKSFIYRTNPVARVISQTSAPTIKVIDKRGIETTVATTGFPKLFYNQFSEYKIDVEFYEEYINKDYGYHIISKVPSTDGELIVTNNLALPGSESYVRDTINTSIIKYTFKAGMPKLSDDFTLTSTLKYRMNAVDYDIINFNNTGIILGSVGTTGEKNFLTSIDDEQALVLRDPPGSNSNTRVDEGETITFNREVSISNGADSEIATTIKSGFRLTAMPGFLMPAYENTIINDNGVNVQYTSEDGTDLTKTFIYTTEMETNPDATHVGDGSDLFVGARENIYYTPIRTVFASDFIPTLPNAQYSTLTVGDTTYYISAKDEVALITEPQRTSFVHSKNNIIKDIIPTYEEFINQINSGTLTPGTGNILTVEEYKEKIFQWKRVLLQNEIDKYLAKNYSDKLKKDLLAEIEYSPIRNAHITPTEVTQYKALVDNNFKKNYIYDSGVDIYNNTIETTVLNRTSQSIEIKNEEFTKLVTGTELNGMGSLLKLNFKYRHANKTTNSQSVLEKTAFTQSYRDDDFGNMLIFDTVNLFDGNSPVYITKGGITSCPWEQQLCSDFFAEAEFKEFADNLFSKKDSIRDLKDEIIALNANLVNEFGNLQSITTKKGQIEVLESQIEALRNNFYDKLKLPIANTNKAALNTGTLNCALRTITVENANLTNIPEDDLAEFKLTLTNISPAGDRAFSNYYLQLLNSDALSGAVFVDDVVENKPFGYVSTSRVGIDLPYNQPKQISIFLKKLSGDKFDFDNIKIALVDNCDLFLRQHNNPGYPVVTLSAHFVPSCSKVKVSEPLNNWVYNDREVGYTRDTITNNYTTKPLKIKIDEFNTNFKYFKKIHLEYRLATASSWTRLKTYYKGTTATPTAGQAPDFYDEAVLNQESSIEAIDSTNTALTYAFDIAALKLSNGEYEIRARSICTNGTEFISPVITGIVDLEESTLFGNLRTMNKPLLLGEELLDEIKIFPIPFEKELTIDANVSSDQTAKLELYSMLGQLLYTKIVKAQSGKNVFQIEPDVLNGVYFLQIEMDGKTTTHKVIKD